MRLLAGRIDRLAPAFVFVAALGVYRLTLAPGLTWAHAGTDGGDLVTAAAVWGVPHPPGYPTYILLGHIFAFLPFGSVAFNLNLMSAVCAAAAAALIAASTLRDAQPAHIVWRAAASIVAGLTLAFGSMLWGQATIAEVHALNALCVALTCFVAPPWAEPRTLGRGERIALGLAWGLSLGNSPTIAALAPITLPALWRGGPGRWNGFAALAAGLGVYLLIPIRAAMQPAINWGAAYNVPDFFWLVSGGLYRGYVLAAPIDVIAQRLLALPRLWLEQVGWVGAIWIGWGIIARHEFRRLAPSALPIALYVSFAASYNTNDSNLYLIPVWVLSTGYLGTGLAALLTRSSSSRVARTMVGVIAIAAVAAMLIGGWSGHDLSRDQIAAEFARGILSSLPADAILVTHADAHTFSLWYYRVAIGLRRDVSIVDARLVGYTWYEAMLAAQGAAPRLPADRNEAGLPDRLTMTNTARPVCDLIPQPRDASLFTLACD